MQNAIYKLLEAFDNGQFADDMIDQFGIPPFLRKILREGLIELQTRGCEPDAAERLRRERAAAYCDRQADSCRDSPHASEHPFEALWRARAQEIRAGK